MDDKAVLLTVVIPYFQRDSGILRKAVTSALRQQDFDAFDMVVVDDGAPVPARDEIGDLIAAHPGRITVIERTNGGAGAARNTGLDSLPEDRRFVAFLDSDDEWAPHHLASAVAVLDRGHDFYFANLFHLDQDVSKFDNEERTNFRTRLRAEEMRALDGLAECYTFCGDMFDRVMYSGNLIMPSTVVYRFDRYPGYRFREDFRYTGEEYLFFAGLARLGARFAFSWRPAVRCGHGVNTYEKATWSTPGHLARFCDEVLYHRYAASTWHLSDRQRRRAAARVWEIRQDFTTASFGHLRRLQFAPLAQIWRFTRRDPAFPALVPLLVLKAIRYKLTHRTA